MIFLAQLYSHEAVQFFVFLRFFISFAGTFFFNTLWCSFPWSCSFLAFYGLPCGRSVGLFPAVFRQYLCLYFYLCLVWPDSECLYNFCNGTTHYLDAKRLPFMDEQRTTCCRLLQTMSSTPVASVLTTDTLPRVKPAQHTHTNALVALQLEVPPSLTH